MARFAACASFSGLWGVIACSSGAAPGPNSCPGVTSLAIYSGGSSAPYLGLGDEAAGAILAVTHAQGGDALCTATRIAPGWALTAKHCLRALEQPLVVPVSFEDGAMPVPAARIYPHANLDLLLLQLAEDPSAAPFFTINREPIDESWVGRRATAAGRGLTDTGGQGALMYVTERISAVHVSSMSIDGLGKSGACLGDSGGPLLSRTSDGSARVVGVLEEGSASCTGADYYTRTDSAAEWIEQTIGAVASTDPGSCGEITEEGRCFDGLSVWCEGGLLRGASCTASEQCGWSPEARGYRCLPSDEDPCRGTDGFGRCEGSKRLRCVSGELEIDDCRKNECARRCGIVPETGEAACEEG